MCESERRCADGRVCVESISDNSNRCVTSRCAQCQVSMCVFLTTDIIIMLYVMHTSTVILSLLFDKAFVSYARGSR